MKKTHFLLLVILILASILRLWHLGKVPPSPNWDEVSFGYNAYSIMQTGKDEYGVQFPLILRSFDDYKPGIYTYFVIPSIKIFGLNSFSVRLPSAIFGILAVFGVYLLTKEILKEKQKANKIALLSSFLLAISPWHIQFSRIAFESNVGVCFNLFAALFFLKGLRKPIWLIISSLLISVNLYIYQSEKVFTPLLFLAIIIIYRKNLLAVPKKYLLISLLIVFIAFTYLAGMSLTNKEIFSRAKGVSSFSDQTQFLKENVIRIAEDQKKNDILGLVLDNRRVLYLKTILSGYISHYDLSWLFITGDISRHHAPNMGLMYLFELPFLLIGIYSLLFGNYDKRVKLLILSWILIVPIPASITSGVPHAVRTLNFLPVLQILTALGLISAIEKILNIKDKIFKIKIAYLILVVFTILFSFNFYYYLSQYFIQQNYFNSADWQFGYKEAVEEVKNIEKNYTKIVVSNKPYLDQSYMFFLFYLKYPPQDYQNESLKSSGGFRENHRFGKFEFRPIDWEKEAKDSKTLYIGRPDDFPGSVNVLKTIDFLNGSPAIKIVGKSN